PPVFSAPSCLCCPDPFFYKQAAEVAIHQERQAADPVPGLVGALRDRRLVLVLDNCEHVIEAAATLAVAILRGAADVHIVATSREPMKDGRRLGQSGRYAGLAPAEYIVSADSSCLTPQRGCTERYQSNSSTSPRS
ncbi:MAG TPA: hypothetical protein VJ251_13805, partial [Stellaceae bacterium]|nr:hypothetical protein [Stellaceae bacterium]